MKNIDVKFANLIAFVFNPFLFLAITLLVSNLNWAVYASGALIFVIGILILLPLLAYGLRIQKEKTSFLKEHDLPRNKRDSLYLFSLYTSLFSVITFAHLGLQYWFLHSLVAFVFVASLYLANKYFDKVSLHTAVFTFCVMYMVDKISTVSSLFLIALPIIIWSRMKLRQHTWLQIYLSIVVGMAIGLLSWTI